MADEDPKHTAFLRGLVCAVTRGYLAPEHVGCSGPIGIHHATFFRGMRQRAHDHEAMPLCLAHHVQFHGACGHFAGWDHERRDAWQRGMVEIYRPKLNPDVF